MTRISKSRTTGRAIAAVTFLALGVVGAAGCDSSMMVLTGAGGAGGTGGAAGGTGGAPDGAVDASPPVCAESLADYCGSATSGECAPTWAAVLADHSYCGSDAGIFAPRDSRGACGSYNVRLLVPHMDIMALSYSDASTGALVAIWHYTAVIAPTGCVAGPSDFVRPCGYPASSVDHCPDLDAGSDR